MKRRSFLQASGGLAATAWLSPNAHAAQAEVARHVPGRITSDAGRKTPKGKRTPFGWKTATISDANATPFRIEWDALDSSNAPSHLRIAIALDHRDEKRIKVTLSESKRVLGEFDIRYPAQFQIYQVELDASDSADIARQGLTLQVTKGSDLEVFVPSADVPAELTPHLLVPGSASEMTEYYARMNTLACIQPFGWMEGCVLDGLLDLASIGEHAHLEESAKKHLSMFIRKGRLVYEGTHSDPRDGRIYGIEGTLPFAAIARLYPDSPVLDLAIKFWKSRRRKDGSIQDGGHLSSEGAYTVGYAIAEVAAARESDELMQMALQQISHRQELLFTGDEFWRTRNDDGHRGNRNWARGIAWQLLGTVRTLSVAQHHADISDLIDPLSEFAQWAMQLRREDGLWSVFADQPDIAPDTGGSAGLAAALAIGAKHGWLDESATAAAGQSLATLQTHLTSDGLLGGVAQSNKGGEALQRGNYRVIYQMGMGLMGQLIAGLRTA